MAVAHEFLARTTYRRIFDSLPARRLKSTNDRMAECEFGPTGRDPRFPSGWFIFPAFVIGALILGFLL
jgi:hypothetical protein